jgi:uncharacterized protein (DUF1697 family)
MMKMDELKSVFEEIGFENVKSYINSGNIAFDTKKTSESKLSEKIEKAVESKFGRPVPVMVREQGAMEGIIKSNPFHGQYEDHRYMHVLFLKDEMPAEKLSELKAAALKGEQYESIGRELYCHLANGVADSLLGKNFIEKKLKVSATGRNWRTVEKLAEL